MSRNREQSSSIMVAGGTDASVVLPTGTRESPTVKRERNYTRRQWIERDTLERVPTHICDPDAKELIRKLMEELKRRGKNIRVSVRREFMPEDVHLFTRKQRRAVIEWCDQVPVLIFNCGRYDLNLMKEHFAELLAYTTRKVQVAKKQTTRCS